MVSIKSFYAAVGPTLIFLHSSDPFVLARKDNQLPQRDQHDGKKPTTQAPGDAFRVFQDRRSNSDAVIRGSNESQSIPMASTNEAITTPIASPTAVPVLSTVATQACPPAHDQKRTDYVTGNNVSIYNTVFTCRPAPYERYCNIATLEEVKLMNAGNEEYEYDDDAEMLWRGAWEEIGKCVISDLPLTPEPVSSPTETPTVSVVPSSRPSTLTSSSPSSLPSSMPSLSPTDFPTTQKPTYSPSSSPSWSPLSMPSTATDLLAAENITCTSPDMIHLRVELVTDNYPTDVTWQFIDRTNNVILLASPSDGYTGVDIGNGMRESQTDTREMCLNATGTDTVEKNRYEFIIIDSYDDGLCCRENVVQGFYKISQYDYIIDNDWVVLASGSNFRAKAHHHFQFESPTLDQSFFDEDNFQLNLLDLSNQPGTSRVTSGLNIICPHPQRKITIEIMTDRFGSDTSWVFRAKNGPVLAKNERTYENKVQVVDSRDVCVEDSSLYEFTVKDKYGDGMCCRYKRGHYKIFTHKDPTGANVQPRMQQQKDTILYGGYFYKNKITHLINTTKPYMDEVDKKWLTSHNKRRKYWHAHYNTSYVSLLWSESLKAEAQVWADHLLTTCTKGE